MNIKLMDLSRQYNPIKKQILNNVEKIIDSTNFIMGENVKEFEKEFSEYIGVKHSISVGNGTDALVIALKALQIKEGDEIITTPYSFFATSEAIVAVGAIPVFVDVDLKTFNIDTTKIEEKITKRTKAILPVHIFGNPCDMEAINKIAKKHKLFVIEDACQAIGSSIKDKKIGGLSDIACFSFFPTKNLGCAGDGGIITTNDDDLATLCKAYRAHGSGEVGNKAYNIINNIDEQVEIANNNDNTVYNPMKYYNYLIGYNSRLDEIQAAILRIKLPLLEEYTKDRIEIANYYNKELENTSFVLPKYLKNSKHVYHLYILQSEKREELIKYLSEKGISTGVYYKIPLHLQKALERFGYKASDCPNAEYLSERTFAIPLYYGMTNQEKEYVVETLKEWSKKNE